MYDPTIGRWNGVDALAEEYILYSPFHYSGNNPIRYVDIDGRRFKDEDKEEIEAYSAELGSKILDAAQELLEAVKLGDKKAIRKGKDRLNSLNNAKAELSLLESSGQVYDLDKWSGPQRVPGSNRTFAGLLSYNKSTDEVVVGYTDMGTLAHELHHAYQFEIGALDLANRDGGSGGNLYDIQDEIDAYRREFYFRGTAMNFGDGIVVRGSEDIDSNLVRRLGYDLRRGPLSLDSPVREPGRLPGSYEGFQQSRESTSSRYVYGKSRHIVLNGAIVLKKIIESNTK